MKKVILVLISLVMLTALSGCTLHLPLDWDYDSPSRVYLVILQVTPDDAQVLLNGKLVGYAYEFSTSQSGLMLNSRNNELVIKKEGYIEEAVNLHQYDSRKITVRMKLLQDEEYAGPAREPRPAAKVSTPKAAEKMPEYTALKEEPKPMPQDVDSEEKALEEKPVNVKITIAPDDAAIYLNGKFWGLSPRSGVIENLRLKPGKYALEVVKPGFKTYTKQLLITDQDVELIIKLENK